MYVTTEKDRVTQFCNLYKTNMVFLSGFTRFFPYLVVKIELHLELNVYGIRCWLRIDRYHRLMRGHLQSLSLRVYIVYIRIFYIITPYNVNYHQRTENHRRSGSVAITKAGIFGVVCLVHLTTTWRGSVISYRKN